MTGSGTAARKRRLYRKIHWRIISFQLPLIVLLLVGSLYWLEGRLERALRDANRLYGLQSVDLAASAFRHSMVSGAAPSTLEWISASLPAGSSIEVLNLKREVIFSSDSARRGRTSYLFTDSPCVSCHVAGRWRSAETAVASEPGQPSYQLFAAPLHNSPDCQSCHRADSAKLGMVYLRQPVSPAAQLVSTAKFILRAIGVVALGLAVFSTRALCGRYLARPRSPLMATLPDPGAAAPGSSNPAPVPPGPSGGPEGPGDPAERLRESLQEIAQQRDQLSTLYFIADQLSRSVQPNVVCKRAVELASSVFGSVCVLVAGHFHPDSRVFHGTVTYHGPGGEIVEHPYPDESVSESASFFSAAIVERWLRGELDGVVRIREGSTVAYPLERHGRRLGLLLAPARGRHESPDGRPTAAHPEVVQVARKHLAIALEMSEMQRERLQQERLAAIGQTVAGLSHCMKNTLIGLKGGKYIIERALSLENPEKLQKGLTVLTSAVQHIERLTHDMLFYAGDRSLVFESTNPNDTMQEIVELLEESARTKGVVLRAELDERMEPIRADRHALYRALLNLVTNAVDACIESEHGSTVTLRSRSEADSVLLSVEDNGVGIPEELLRRVTERFFTTKASKGTGLGLPVVQKIAEQHGGTLEVESVLGQGSAFHLRLPRMAAVPLPEAERVHA